MAILRQFANGLILGTGQLPQGSLSIDWSNPLTRGLACYNLPGVTIEDVTGQSGPLIYTNGTPFIGISPEGPALDFSNNNVTNGIAGTTEIPGQTTAMSIYTRIFQVSAVTNHFAAIAGVTYSTPSNASPFVTLWVTFNGSASAIALQWSNSVPASVLLNFVGTVSTKNTYGLGGTISNGGNAKTYYNGLPDASTAGVNFLATGTGANIVGTDSGQQTMMLAVWNRELSADEMLQIHLRPYEMLVPIEYEMPSLKLPPAAATHFRRTLSPVGARVGTRQAILS